MQALITTCRNIASLADEPWVLSDLARLIMEELRRLIPCDSINLGTVDLQSEEGFHFALDGFLMPPDRRSLLPLFKHQNPIHLLAGCARRR